MSGHGSENFVAQDGQQIGRARDGALMRKQNLQTVARYGGGPSPLEQIEKVHAALRPKSLPNSPTLSDGTVISMSSPISLRAASE